MSVISVPAFDRSRARLPVSVSELLVVTDAAEPEQHCAMIRIIDEEKGDERITWDRRDMAQIKEAKQLFLDLIAKGLKPFRVDIGGKPSVKVMRKFDATAEEIVFYPKPLAVGG